MAGSPVNVAMVLLCLFLVSAAGFGGEAVGGGQAGTGTVERILLSFGGGEAVVKICDHRASRELVSRLPMTLDFRDYAGKEKIAYLSNKLAPDGPGPLAAGDFAYYEPWGNLAIFYQGNGNAGNGLIILGIIESGKEALAAMDTDFTMTLSVHTDAP